MYNLLKAVGCGLGPQCCTQLMFDCFDNARMRLGQLFVRQSAIVGLQHDPEGQGAMAFWNAVAAIRRRGQVDRTNQVFAAIGDDLGDSAEAVLVID